MGCWNTTCGISGLPIYHGEEVVVFLLVENDLSFMKDFVWSDTYFEPCLLPFYGQYNDYGSVENCSGAGLSVILNALRSKMTEMDWGENKSHDIPAKRDELTVENMFDLDREDRLFIDWVKEYKDVIKAEDRPLRVVHMQIKKSIFDYILNNFAYGRKMLAEAEKTAANNKRTNALRKAFESTDKEMIALLDDIDFEEAYRMERGKGNQLLSAVEVSRTKNPEAIKDLCKGAVIDVFMGWARKAWIKPIGNGSQDTNYEAHELLMAGMKEVIAADKKEYGWEDEDESHDKIR